MGACCGKNDDQGRGRANTFDGDMRISESRRVTLAPNMKNFKNLRYVENISSLYNFGKQLGKGSFGSVNVCTRNGTGDDVQFAIKTINKKSLNANPSLPALMMNELTIL